MTKQTAKITKIQQRIEQIRLKFGIPLGGFENEKQGLEWYTRHYEEAKGKPFSGRLGYRFADFRRTSLEFDYEYDQGRFSVSFVPPIDQQVPFDREILLLGGSARIDFYLMPALRLLVLVRSPLEFLPYIARYIFVPLGAFRLLMQPPGLLSEKQRGQLLDDLNNPETNRQIGFGRKNYRNYDRYQEVYCAYAEWVREKTQREQKGEIVSRKGYLVWIAKRLKNNYKWNSQPSSYTVKRYLDRGVEYFNFPKLEK